MTTKTKEVRIGSIKLVDGGNKGLLVTYEQTEIRNNREFLTEMKAKKKFPIHEELDKVFKWLKPYLLELCNYENSESLENGLEIISVKYNDSGFQIFGKMEGISGKGFPIQTEFITPEDGYPDYGKVCAILDGIYSEAKEYMEGKKVLSDIQYVMNLNKGNQNFDQKTFESLPAEEQAKICSEYMAKNKMIALHVDDFEEESEEKEEPKVYNLVQEAVEKTPSVEEDYKFTEMDAPKTPIDDDNFIVAIAEPVVAKSTAKKKA